MKLKIPFIFLIFFLFSNSFVFAVQSSNEKSSEKISKTIIKKKKRFFAKREKQLKNKNKVISMDKLSFILGASSVLIHLAVLIFAIPYISFFGVILGIGAFIVGIFARRKKQKNKFSKWGIILGILSTVYFLAVLALVLFV